MSNEIQGFQLAPQQRRLWMALRDGARCHAACAVLIEGELRADRLRAALQQVADRHQALRTTFQRLPGMKMPVQVVAERAAPEWSEIDLRGLDPAEQDQRIDQLFAAQLGDPFDLARGSIVRAALLALGERRNMLLVGLPALCADAWTLANLARELGRAYAAPGDAADEDPPQYLQFSEWQNELLQDEDAEAGRAYWSKRAAPAPIALPFEAAPRERSGFAAATLALPIGPELSAQVAALARERETSVANILLAAWMILLWRLTGQPVVSVGVAADGRAYDELHDAFGLFARWLPITARFERNQRFDEALQALAEAYEEAYEWQDYFVVEPGAAGDEAAPREPFFAAGFEHARRADDQRAGGARFRVERQSCCIEPFKIKLSSAESAAALLAELSYDSQLFAPQDVARLAQHYRQLLAHAVADPAAAIDALDLLGEAERRRLVVDLNATAADHPRADCVDQLFERQAARAPDAVAVVFDARMTRDEGRTARGRGSGDGDQDRDPGADPWPLTSEPWSLSYGALDRRANQLARILRARGVGPDSLVGIYMERAPELVVALLGVLKAGSAYLPLDLEYPPERLAFMLEDSRATLIVTKDDRRKTNGASQAEPEPAQNDERRDETFVLRPSSIVNLAAEWPQIAQLPADPPARRATADNLAYVIYTSGSTGQPKGVMITHRGAVNYLSWAARAYDLAGGTGALVHSPLGFDLTVTSLLGPLVAGQRVLLPSEDQGIDALGTALGVERDLSLVKLTPSHLEIINGQARADQLAGRARAMVLGGEALWAEQIALWRVHAPDTRIINEYGPTETVVGCCVYEVPRDAPSSGVVPIGRPIANTQIYLLDAQLRPVPVGVAGEIYIGGAQLARGYLGRPDLTAERFVPNPFAPTMGDVETQNIASLPRPHTRLYKTGDLARRRADDEIEYLGRIDQQVKLRGFRIELGEITARLIEHPAVRDAVVIVREDAPASGGPPERRLAAYLALRPGQSPTVSELRRFLQARLPDYMLPAAFVTLDALPLTPNGKIDRAALPAPDSARPDLGGELVAPRDEVEAALAAIWATVLRLERVGVHDNFFALGGDSILSIQVIAKAHQAGIHLTPRQMFQHQTIAELAAVADTAPAALAEQGPVVGPAPLTPIQRHFFEQDLPNPQHFNQALLLAPRRRLAPALLSRALAALLAHHDALRLRFARDEQGWRATNADVGERPALALISLARIPPERQADALSAAAGAIQRGMNLADGPLIRAALFDLGADRPGRILLAVHHLAMDGVSWRVLIEDLQSAYEQLERGEPIALPPKTTAYQQWGARLAMYAHSEALLAERDYWRAFGALPAATLPRDRAHGANAMETARTTRVALDADETRALLQDAPAAYHTQINDILMTALAQAAGAWSGSERLLVDLEGHGREDLFADVDLSRTVGWFTTLYPVLLDLSGATDPGAALRAVKEQLRAIPQRGIGYGVLRYLTSDPDIRALPPAEIKFNYLGQVDQATGQGDGLFGGARESSGPTRDPRGSRTHLIEVTGVTAGEQLWLEWTYSADLHDHATIAGLAERYLAALRNLIAHCVAPDSGGYTPSDFPEMNLTQEELDDLIAEL